VEFMGLVGVFPFTTLGAPGDFPLLIKCDHPDGDTSTVMPLR